MPRGRVRRRERRDNLLNLGQLRRGQYVLPSPTFSAETCGGYSELLQLAPSAEPPPLSIVVPFPVRDAGFRDLQKAVCRVFLKVSFT